MVELHQVCTRSSIVCLLFGWNTPTLGGFKGLGSMADNPTRCEFCAKVAITILVLLASCVCLAMAASYLITKERGPSVAAAQTKSPALDGVESALGH